MDYGIKLVCQTRTEVMARPFSFGFVDHPDCAFKPATGERLPRRRGWQHEPLEFRIVKQAFVAVWDRWIDASSFRRLVPFACSGDRSRMRREANEEDPVAVSLAR